MSVLFIILIVYLIGGVLSSARFYAEFKDRVGVVFYFIVSWLGLFVGTILWEDGKWLQFRDPKKLKAKRKAHKKALKSANITFENEPYRHNFETKPPEMHSWSQ